MIEKIKQYQALIAIFAMTFLMAIAAAWSVVNWDLNSIILVSETFIALSICVLAILKFQDLKGFQAGFAKYDIIAQKLPVYGLIYPFLQTFIGIGMISGLLTTLVAILAVIVGFLGSITVVQAVNRAEKPAFPCIGCSDQVPINLLSLIGTMTVLVMGGWMLMK